MGKRFGQDASDRDFRHSDRRIRMNNELNCELSEFYSDADDQAFRDFLIDKYKGIDSLNKAWGNAFWNQTYTAWEIEAEGRAVELTLRQKDGRTFLFVLNYYAEEAAFVLKKKMISLFDEQEAFGRVSLPGFGTAVYEVR